MRKSVFVLAVIGAACSSVAFAAEVKNDKAHVPAVKATTMSDADMDKVTAGAADNNFNNASNTVTLKFTGSASKGADSPNPGALNGGNGTLNFHQHVPH